VRNTSSRRPDSRCSSLSFMPVRAASSESAGRIGAPPRGSRAQRRQFPRLLELHGDGVVIARARGQPCRGVVRDDAALRDDDRSRAHRVDLFEDVGGDHDDLVARHVVDQRAHLVLLVRVEAVGGLIEYEHRRIVHDRLRQSHAPTEALRERLDALLEHTLELQVIDDVPQARRAPRPLEPAQIGDEREKTAHGHLTVARGAFGQVAERGFGGEGITLDVVSADARLPRGRGDEAREHAHGGGLAGAVGAEKPEHFAGSYLEAHVFHCREHAVVFGEVFGLDHALLGSLVRSVAESSRPAQSARL